LPPIGGKFAVCDGNIYLFQVCEICADPFEQFWDEESEEWHLKDAIRVEGKTYHPVCYEDAKLVSL
jgi:hypothetical protein